MKKYMKVRDNSMQVNILVDNVDFLNMSSQNEYAHLEFSALFSCWRCAFVNAMKFREDLGTIQKKIGDN